VLDQIFDRSSPPRSRAYRSGIVHRLRNVQQNSGGIAVEMRRNCGTTIRIYLPEWRPAPHPVIRRRQPSGPSRRRNRHGGRGPGGCPAHGGAGPARYGYPGSGKLRTARPRSNWPCYNHGPIDIVVTDVVMPVLGGQDLAERLRTLRPATKVLFTSGYWDEAISRHGALLPGTQYLAKPFTPEPWPPRCGPCCGTSKPRPPIRVAQSMNGHG